jgi:hypothetical protein
MQLKHYKNNGIQLKHYKNKRNSIKSVLGEYSVGQNLRQYCNDEFFYQNKKLLKPTHVLKEDLSVDNTAILL